LGRASQVVHQEPAAFYLNQPFTKANGSPMDEFISTYLLMFFLGSLVRYRPAILEAMLEKEDAWMIESIMRSTPTSFLRHARNALTGERFVFCAR